MVKINKVLIKDDMDAFYDVILFNENVNLEEVEKVIINCKKKYEGEWTLEDIDKAIQDNFNVKEILIFDYMAGTLIDVNNVEEE